MSRGPKGKSIKIHRNHQNNDQLNENLNRSIESYSCFCTVVFQGDELERSKPFRYPFLSDFISARYERLKISQ